MNDNTNLDNNSRKPDSLMYASYSSRQIIFLKEMNNNKHRFAKNNHIKQI